MFPKEGRQYIVKITQTDILLLLSKLLQGNIYWPILGHMYWLGNKTSIEFYNVPDTKCFTHINSLKLLNLVHKIGRYSYYCLYLTAEEIETAHFKWLAPNHPAIGGGVEIDSKQSASILCPKPLGCYTVSYLQKTNVLPLKCPDRKSFSPHTSVSPDTHNNLAGRRFPKYVKMAWITMNIDLNYPDSLLKVQITARLPYIRKDFFKVLS